MSEEQQQMNQPLVAISILNWMNVEDSIACIRSIQALDYPNYTLIVRDNASQNDSFEQLKKTFPDLRIERSSDNQGYAAGHYANYLLAKELGAELFWILNSDLELKSNCLSALVEAYQKQKNAIYGSVSLNPSNTELIDFGGASLRKASSSKLTYNEWKDKKHEDYIAEHPELNEVEAVEGSSMMIPMKVIDEKGFMDLDYFMYGEETTYCYRLRAEGIPSFIVSQSVVMHHNEGSFKAGEGLKIVPAYYRRRNALRFSMEHLGMKRINALAYQNGIWQNIKTILAGIIKGKKDLNYFYALACWHAFLGKKGKVVEPEKLID